MGVNITAEYEFGDVLCMFPILKKTLREDLHLNVSEIQNGETVKHFFQRKAFSSDEIRIVLRKMNQRVNSFLKSPLTTPVSCYDNMPLKVEEEEEE